MISVCEIKIVEIYYKGLFNATSCGGIVDFLWPGNNLGILGFACCHHDSTSDQQKTKAGWMDLPYNINDIVITLR